MSWDGVLVRFGEIGIKSPPVRRRMLDKLRQNLLDQMVVHGVEGDVRQTGPRLWMVGPDPVALAGVAQRTFGVVSASPAVQCAATMEAMAEAAARLALDPTVPEWSTFAIRAKREGEHPFSSQEVGIQVGSAVFKAAEAAGRAPKVDLGSPQLELHLDIRDDLAYAYMEALQGPGGLPMGVQGKVLALLSDPASFVAAWLMMRRGCRVSSVHAGQAQSLPTENLEALQAWGLGKEVDLLPICTGFVSKSVLVAAAQELALRIGAIAVVTGETLDSPLAVPEGPIPVLRPVCGLPPIDVARYAAAIGLVEEEPEHILDDASRETVETALSMHRIVEA